MNDTRITDMVTEAQIKALQCIRLERMGNSYYHKHRGVELIFMDAEGERISEEYYDLPNTITAAQIENDLKGANLTGVASICLQGGVDAYDSLESSIDDDADYAPMVGCWETMPIDIYS
tara:strand:- start:2202 stop:2558 length:357 start_codon:yes stop_codon:yes gene_type:complete